MSFFDEFKHIVPYFVKVSVGKDKQFKIDPSKRNNNNHKGKMIATYKKAETAEELQEHGLGEYQTYIPAEQISMPIDIRITSDEKLTPVFEETEKSTNKNSTHHDIRIFNKGKSQVGYVSINLTPSGDIVEKSSFYESPDQTEKIQHMVFNDFVDGRVVKNDMFEFQKNSKDGTKKVRICQREGKVVGCYIIEQDTETREDVLYQSITEFAKDEKTPKLRRYLASCVADEIDSSKRGGTLIPWECMTLEEDLLEYQKKKYRFEQYAVQWHYSALARYLQDDSNNRLRDFKGDYIGNILNLTDKGYEACIVTKHQKGGKDYRLYTLIDLTGTNITKGSGIDGEKDPQYLKRIEEADKTPTFVTRVNGEGKEKLVLHKGQAITGECPEYTQFVETFITPLSEIKPMQISKILNREEKDK